MTPPDVMSADEARAWLDDTTLRPVCAMCRVMDPPTRPAMIGPDAIEVHDGCPAEAPTDGRPGVAGVVRMEAAVRWPDDAVRALRAVVALHGRAAGAWLAGAEAARAGDVAALRAEVGHLMGAGGCADLVAGMPLPAPPAPPQRPAATPDGGTEPEGAGAPARGLPVAGTGD